MATLSPDLIPLTFSVQAKCPCDVWVVDTALDLPEHRQIIILPNSSTSQEVIVDFYGKMASKSHLTPYRFTGAVPFHYLSDVFLALCNPCTPHPVTPLPSIQQHTLYLPVEVYTDDEERKRHNFPHPIFELSGDSQRKPLAAKICLPMTLRLVGKDYDTRGVAWQYPAYHVVGSLGMNSQDEEILLLKSSEISPANCYHYVELIVHPTHVDEEIGFILSPEARWRDRNWEKLEEWHRDDPLLDIHAKNWSEELLYMKQVVYLRNQ